MEVLTFFAGATFGPAVGAFFFFRWRHAQAGYSVVEGAVTFVVLLATLIGYVFLMMSGEAVLTGKDHSEWLAGPGVVALFLGLFLLPALVGLLFGHIAALVVKRMHPGTGR
ncbi:hypothetical protein ABAC460_11210 [Asticcacaulis sp. AC460]|uniref:hypothetical protein n=1 Tax=Asticcacaulis sp. AC460 TaxID=1282360 RepID=UPI0003C3BBE5|nr:hypothetical protein [Asticcacaulis sp. AC460]ESQ89863.1 hypothetical protein ABAC460_11210 [Asticcacaulis sp. AC460]